jgi:hypothetical protein
VACGRPGSAGPAKDLRVSTDGATRIATGYHMDTGVRKL